jgi:hypothetical protein
MIMTEFISRKYGQEGFEFIIKTYNKEHYNAAEGFARKLIDHAKPQTNADRIRAMSDEELTDAWIRDNTICHRCAYRDESECDEFVTNEKCREGILEWLKQPVKEGSGND